jgi:hypothetical protein
MEMSSIQQAYYTIQTVLSQLCFLSDIITNTEYEADEGTIMVTNQKSKGNLVVSGFYTPSHQVENNKDNDGGTHPGSL